MADLDLSHFAAAVHAHVPTWERSAIQWQLTVGPERSKSAAWVLCETGDRVGQLTVWTSGEAELEIGNLDTGAIDQVHYDLVTTENLAACLSDLTRRLTTRT